MQDLIAGRVEFTCEQISTAYPQIKAGAVKALATLALERQPLLADLPTAKEQGLDLDCSVWISLAFPKGTAGAIVRRLAEAANDAVETPAVRERFANLGVAMVAPLRRTPEYLTGFVPREIEKWAGPIKASGAHAD
jgi:tripartite-type tricarboxylate transporter receptor subunit TctC